MAKKKSPPSGKRAKADRKKGSYPDKDPEWDHLEERFSTLNSDFGKLAEIVSRDPDGQQG